MHGDTRRDFGVAAGRRLFVAKSGKWRLTALIDRPSPLACGGWGIRTPEGLHPTRFPSVRHRPLGESSWRAMRPTSIAEILDMRRIIDVTSNAPRGASRYSEPRMRNRLVVDSRLSHWRLAAALKAIRCSDAWNGVNVRSAVASAHCPGRRGSSLHWRLPRWRGCRLCRRLGRGSSCGVTSQNSPRAGRQQGYAGSGGCVGSPLFRPMQGRLSLERAHRQSGEAKRPGQGAGRYGEAIELNGNRAAVQGVKARRPGGASS